VHRSLQRLRTDVLDVVLVHSDGAAELLLEELGTLDALRELRRAGAVRAVGVSTKTVAGALRAVAACDVVMLTLHPGATDDLPAIEAARARGVGVLIKKALASGHAAAPGSGPAAGDAAAPASNRAQDPVATSLAFALRTPGVSSVIVGTTSPAHLAHNCDAADAATR
jgi:aryl-alcohol dehydrogenase-like predicted oxidoreductase